ncbi:hypothetical protein [Pontibacter litorisediminis]|uniref:hypothetical protein n=1 Tax=Pontibacter litorisediminis TaxID=1846260 RepID=UPI0023ECFA83|nr:hypothetical protein [Pontibacter litorisediminis]
MNQLKAFNFQLLKDQCCSVYVSSIGLFVLTLVAHPPLPRPLLLCMKTELITHKPSLKAFLQYFAVMLGFVSVLVPVLYLIFNQGEPFLEYFRSAAVLYFFLPLFNAGSFAFASRKHQLTIYGVDNAAQVADWAVELLQKNGLRAKTVTGSNTVLESDKKLLRSCGNWFGAELVEVRHEQEEVIITGHSKYVDIPESKIRFGNAALQFKS